MGSMSRGAREQRKLSEGTLFVRTADFALVNHFAEKRYGIVIRFTGNGIRVTVLAAVRVAVANRVLE
jgi:hypothetical protein